MISNFLRLRLPVKDGEFDLIYPKYLRDMSEKHFTEVEVAIKVSELLNTTPGQKVLDIGSGVGKFCFVAGAYSDAMYTGVDYRKQFIELCDDLTVKHNFKNVNFIHSDIIDIDFKEYDHFYFFNSFEEHANVASRMDNLKDTSTKKFIKYSHFLKEQFDKLPIGTKIVTYYAYSNQVPNSYELESIHFDGTLKYWVKKHKSYNN
jgi:cyclopropane fatty-acyl-phospholipid synthase-like methyltransferase